MMPKLHISCTDCEEIDLTVSMGAIGISAAGVRDRTREKADEIISDYEGECEACGGTVTVEEVEG